MRTIILASSSPQRRKIMDILGLPYKIIPSHAQEITTLTKSVEHLVKHNAYIKAKDVAARQKSAIVIGSDTVVYSGKKRLILKPRNHAEALKNLKELMAQPHWVYTGVAIIDSKTGRTSIFYDKTKVFMTPLSNQEIERYHKKVSPLDKAGGFDIEGKGGMFIPRIEGDYFNVVGLPLAKLAAALKKFGMQVL